MRISPQSVGVFLQSVGFPVDIQGPGSSRNVLLHFLHNKAIEDGNQTCSPPFLARLHEVHRAIVVTSVIRVYVYVRVTLSVKVF